MPVLKCDHTPAERINDLLERRIIYGNDLMTAILDYSNGTSVDPEPPHTHPHEQTTYVAQGEIMFICEDEPPHYLQAGDVFFVPSGKKHTIQLLTDNVRLIDSFTPLRKDLI